MRPNAFSSATALSARLRMFKSLRAQDAADRDLPSDPLADLMFTMIAIVLLALIILLPLASFSSPTQSHSKSARRLENARFAIGSKSAVAITASARGLRLPGGGARLIGLDAIAGDAALQKLLTRARDRGSPLVVLITPKGSEAAFELEPLLSAYGPKQVYQVRLDQACLYARSTILKQACGASEPRR